MNLRNTVGIVLLAAAAGASYYWSRTPPADTGPQGGGAAALPGYYLHGAKLVGTDAAGRIAYRIQAESLAEIAGDRLALDGVRVDYTPADEAPWSISGARASAPKDRSQLDLEGDVEVRSAPTDGSAPWQISTASLRFVPNESLVSTDGPVKVRIGGWHLDGVGLRVHLNADKLELESKVHGRFSR